MKMCAPKKTVLFVCTHNAIRSQIAEALLNEIYGDRYTAYSAGSDPTQMDPLVKTVMSEMDIDVSHHHSKGFSVFQEVPWTMSLHFAIRPKSHVRIFREEIYACIGVSPILQNLKVTTKKP